jgi:hypothetical protein
VVAVSWLEVDTTTSTAAAPPIVTVAPATKFEPLIVTLTPPMVVPLFGEMPLTLTEDGLVEELPHADTKSATAQTTADLRKGSCGEMAMSNYATPRTTR